jgi:general secretion pathway protein D
MRLAASTSLALAGGLLVPAAATAQIVKQEEKNFIVTFDEAQGTDLAEFITSYQRISGKAIHYEQKDIENQKIFQLGSKVVPKDRFDIYFGAVLRNLDFLMVQFGPEDAGFLALRKLGQQTRGQQALKTQAQIVLPSELPKLADNPGLLATTSILTKYLPAREAVTTLQLYFADTATESIRNIEGTNTILMTGFANNLQGIVRLLGEIDKEPADFYPLVTKRKLNHAVADEIQPVLKELIDAYMGSGRTATGGAQPGGRQRGPGLPGIEPEPTVIADARTNTLLVTAGAKTMEKIVQWIDLLDIEVDPRGDTHVFRLRNSRAEEMADVLEQIVSGDTRRRGSTGRGGGPTGGGPGGGPSGGLPGTTGGAGEQPVVIVPDKATNSLVITASKTRYAQLLEIIKRLDIRPHQVLIQAALIEITGSLNELLGVELAAVDVNATDKTGFGISSFGITDLVDTDGDGFPDSRALTDPLSTGLTGGIFDPDDFALPFVLQAVATQSDSNILSLPSVLTNDNEQAEVTADDVVPYTQTNQGQNTDTTSFGGEKTAGIRLKISPTISAGGYLRLAIELEVSAFSGQAVDPTVPPPSLQRKITTSVTIPDGHTMVFGGVITDDQRSQEDKIPILGDLPVIGFLFRNSNNSSKKTNLYFFLTPHIIADDFATLDELTAKHKLEAEKLGGKVQMLNRFFESTTPEAEQVSEAWLDRYYELPAYASVADRPASPADAGFYSAER